MPSLKAALANELEKQLAIEAKKRQPMGKEFFPYPSEKGQARAKAGEVPPREENGGEEVGR